jgi:hypothetical protein
MKSSTRGLPNKGFVVCFGAKLFVVRVECGLWCLVWMNAAASSRKRLEWRTCRFRVVGAAGVEGTLKVGLLHTSG